ncbi:MAG: nucleoside-diphosphate kinase [Bacteroidales bacterium]|jgi:nucleoside-diphosphate kinase|nr:nucleoside-diphosphate kinase [Bacteroidales bacterium]MDD4214805.1 nucleoside-diphosphate kinase [Bacteroidales bacterium]
MAGSITLAIIKPEAFSKNKSGKILARITEAGFMPISVKTMKLSLEHAARFYEVHKNKDFYEGLVEFMCSGPIMAVMLQKENAVEDFRKLIGKTNPVDAAEGTIRHDFGTTLRANAIHGSDSDENALKECNFFFAEHERFYLEG